MRLFVTGGSGLLGSEIVRRAHASDRVTSVVATLRRQAPPATDPRRVTWLDVDLAHAGAMERAIQAARPDAVVHTAVSAEPSDFASVIVRGSLETARAACGVGARFIHLSSDMVFDGERGPYDEDATPAPITAYGRAKAEAERAVRDAHPGAFIVRTSLLYRLEPPDQRTAAWVDDLRAGRGYPLFTDEVRCPAAAGDLAEALLALVTSPGAEAKEAAEATVAPPRVLHLAGPEPITRYELGRALLAVLGYDPDLARPGRIADAGLVRPRSLVLLSRSTPEWLTARLRPLAEVASARRQS